VLCNISGAILVLKGYPRKYQPVFSIDVKDTKVVIQGFGHGDPTDRWIYTPEKVWIERLDGTVTASRDFKTTREQMMSHELKTPWDDLHLAYFSGYALHNYLTAPFYFVRPGFKTREVEDHQENGEIWRVLEVTYPNDYPTHSKIQLFYYDRNFMLRRVDYSPEVTQGCAGHYTFDAQEFSGIKVPTFRRIVQRKPEQVEVNGVPALRGWTWLSGPSLFKLEYRNVIVRDKES
jgi:hypothetical protein